MKILYFAWLKDKTGISEEEINVGGSGLIESFKPNIQVVEQLTGGIVKDASNQ